MAFAGQDPGFRCLDSAGDVISNSSMADACNLNATKHCHELIFDSSMKTVVSEWSLVCDRAWIVALITTVQNIGVLVGYLAAGHAADHIGRKPVFFSAISIMVIFNFVAYFSVSWVMFAVVRFCIGFGAALYFPVRDNMMIEVASPRWRPILIGIPSFAMFAAFLGLLAWLLKNWRTLHLAIGCFGIPILLTWFVPESIRWLVTKKHYEAAEKTVNKIAKINRKPKPDLSVIFEVAKEENENRKTERKYTVVDMFKTRETTKYTLVLCFAWFSVGFGYFGITYGVNSLSGNLYMNIFLLNIVEAPAIMSIAFLVNRFGRRKVTVVFLLLSATTGISVGVLQSIDYPVDGRIMNALSITSKVSCTSGWTAFLILSVELYPTVIRAVAAGSFGMASTTGSIVAPQIVFLNNKVPGVLYLSCGVLMMITSMLILLCKETKDMPLNDTLAAGSNTVEPYTKHCATTAEESNTVN